MGPSVRAARGGRPDPVYAQFGHWRVTLEASVRGVGAVSGAEYDTRTVAVFWPGGMGNDTTFSVALAAQPDTALLVPFPASPDPAAGDQPGQGSVRAPVRAPYLFEAMRVSPR